LTVKPNLWICATALIQSTDPRVVELQVGASFDPSDAPFTKALAEAQKVLIVRNSVCDIYERIWCCWELYCASVQGHTSRPGGLIVVGPAEKSEKQGVVDVALAKASCLDDKRKILTKIFEDAVGYEHINRVLTQVKSFEGDAADSDASADASTAKSNVSATPGATASSVPDATAAAQDKSSKEKATSKDNDKAVAGKVDEEDNAYVEDEHYEDDAQVKTDAQARTQTASKADEKEAQTSLASVNASRSYSI